MHEETVVFGRCYLLLVIDKNSLNNTGVRHLGRQDGMIGGKYHKVLVVKR